MKMRGIAGDARILKGDIKIRIMHVANNDKLPLSDREALLFAYAFLMWPLMSL